MVVFRGWGEGDMGSYRLMDIDFQFEMINKLVEIDGGDHCTTMGMYFMPLNCTIKMVTVLGAWLYHSLIDYSFLNKSLNIFI